MPIRVIMVGNGIRMYRGSTELEYTLAPSGGQRKGPFWRSEDRRGPAVPQSWRDLHGASDGVRRPSRRASGAAAGAAPPPPVKPGEPFPIPPYNRDAEQEYAKGVTSIALTGGVIDPVTIETGRLRSVVGALQKCSDDLLTTRASTPPSTRR